ncbi:hypothetical protein PCANB_002578 [Pneumocystis canis]|nr:hypothetical protein PCK1_002623 [Pneumocystis canis]KAG5438475.1 hypothetical protein PCANB_002578 [Pneumocystis canis]
MGFGQTLPKIVLNPPLYGSFPLDHEGECSSLMKIYLQCLKQYQYEQSPCKDLAKAYLQCRVDRSLFQAYEIQNLGFQQDHETKSSYHSNDGYKENKEIVIDDINPSDNEETEIQLTKKRLPLTYLSKVKDQLRSYHLLNNEYTLLPTTNERDLESITSNTWKLFKLSYSDRIIIFAVCILGSIMCFIFSIFLMTTLFKPRKVVLLWTIGNLFFLISFSALQGPWTYIKYMFSMPRLPFTCFYIGSMISTLYFVIKLKSTFLSFFSGIIQLFALLWYLISYFLMGSQGIQWGARFVISKIKSSIGV